MKNLLIKIFAVFTLLILLFPVFVQAQTVDIPNPIKSAPANSPNATAVDIVFASFIGFAGLFALLAMGFMIISAFKLIVAAGNEEAIETGKRGVTWSVVSFFIAIFAFAMVSGVSKIFGGSEVNELQLGNNLALPTQEAGFTGVFTTFLRNLLALVAVAAALMIVYGGVRMVTSRGNEEQVALGKKIVQWSVVGLLIIVMAFVILAAINAAFAS